MGATFDKLVAVVVVGETFALAVVVVGVVFASVGLSLVKVVAVAVVAAVLACIRGAFANVALLVLFVVAEICLSCISVTFNDFASVSFAFVSASFFICVCCCCWLFDMKILFFNFDPTLLLSLCSSLLIFSFASLAAAGGDVAAVASRF